MYMHINSKTKPIGSWADILRSVTSTGRGLKKKKKNLTKCTLGQSLLLGQAGGRRRARGGLYAAPGQLAEANAECRVIGSLAALMRTAALGSRTLPLHQRPVLVHTFPP